MKKTESKEDKSCSNELSILDESRDHRKESSEKIKQEKDIIENDSESNGFDGFGFSDELLCTLKEKDIKNHPQYKRQLSLS